jgi:O-antigen/teichoic acid export membrane protein
LKSFFQVFSFDVASKVLLGIIGILLIRYMPQSEYAAYTFALSLIAFTTQSLTTSFNRIYIVAHKKLGFLNAEKSFVGLQLILIFGLILLGLPVLSSLGDLYWIIALLMLASCLSEFAKTFFQQNLKFLKFSLIEFYRSLLFFFCTVTLIYLKKSELTAGSIMIVQTIALLMVFWWSIGRRLSSCKSMEYRKITNFAAEIAKGDYRYLFAYFFILGIFSQTDVFMLKAIGEDSMIATYGSAFRYYSILSLALGSVHTVLLPMIQKATSDQELNIIFTNHRKMVLLYIPIVIFSVWGAKWAIPWIDMGKYPDAVITFRILCVSAIISFSFSPHVNIVMRFEEYKFLVCLIVIAFFMNVGINIWLIPIFGAIGVGIATLISAAIVTIPIFFQSKKLIKKFIVD